MDAFLRAVILRRADEQVACFARGREIPAVLDVAEPPPPPPARLPAGSRCRRCGRKLTRRNTVGFCQTNSSCTALAMSTRRNQGKPAAIPCPFEGCGRRMRLTFDGMRYYCTQPHKRDR